jgi:hypothetical protein
MKTKRLMIYDATTIKDGRQGFGNDGVVTMENCARR